jgi:hypothetical protein
MEKYLATKMRAEAFNKYETKEKPSKPELSKRPPRPFRSKRKISVAFKSNTLVLENNKIAT